MINILTTDPVHESLYLRAENLERKNSLLRYRLMEADAIISEARTIIDDGFNSKYDGDRRSYECLECEQLKIGEYGNHTKDCNIGKVITSMEKFLNGKQ